MSEIAEKIVQADKQASVVHDAIYAEPFDKQKASDELWKLHEILREQSVEPTQPAAPPSNCAEYELGDPFEAAPAAPVATPPAPNDAQKLADAIVDCAVRVGITDGKQPLTGPQLLLLLDDVARGYEKGDAADAEQRAQANHCPTCGAFPVDIAAATAATPPAPDVLYCPLCKAEHEAVSLHGQKLAVCPKLVGVGGAFISTAELAKLFVPPDAEQRARAEQIVRGVIVPKGHTIIGVDGEVTILVGRQLIHDIAAALPATDAQRIRDEVWEEAAHIAEKPRVVFGTPLTAMQELAQDIAAEIRAKRGTQDV